ncbi:MAG: hypothetical protein QXS41_02395 [Candidatus Woesearchaeota archaeon]
MKYFRIIFYKNKAIFLIIFFLVLFFVGCINKKNPTVEDFNPLKIYLENKKSEVKIFRTFSANINFEPSEIKLKSYSQHQMLYIYFYSDTPFKEMYVYPSSVFGIKVESKSTEFALKTKISYQSWMKESKITIPVEVYSDSNVKNSNENSELFFYFYIFYSIHQTVKYKVLNEYVVVEIPPQKGPLQIVNAYGRYIITKNVLSLYFEIENVGDGMFFDSKVFESHFLGFVDSKYINKVNFFRYNIGTGHYELCDVGEFINNKIKVRCDIIFNDQTLRELNEMNKNNMELEKVTNILLNYGYLITRKIYIQKE